MNKSLTFQLGNLVIRPWQEGDEESLARHADNIRIWQTLRDIFPHPYTRQDAMDWIGLNSSQENPANFAIVVENEAVGGIGFLFKQDVYRKNAEIGYWLGEAFWNRGIVSRAVKRMVAYAFKTFDIHRIYACVFSSNPASMKVLEKAGFQKEAVIRQSVYKENRYLDEHVYSLLKESG